MFIILYFNKIVFYCLPRSTPVKISEKTYLKKCSELVKAINEIEEALYKVASHSNHYEVAIGFGTALTSLKQIFTINAASNKSKRKFLDNSVFLSTMIRQLGFVLVQNLDWEKEISQGHVFVLVKTARPEVDIGIIPCDRFKLNESKHKMHIDVNFEHPDIDEENGVVTSEVLQETSSTLSSNLDKVVAETKSFVTVDVINNFDRKESLPVTKSFSPTDKTTSQECLSWYKIPISLRGFKNKIL